MTAFAAPAELPLKALSPADRDALLAALQENRRPSMAVQVQTTMCMQRFINAGMVSEDDIRDMEDIVKQVKEARGLKRQPRVMFVNATELGGGVAEMRLDTVALFRDLKASAQWLVIDGADRFYGATVHIHEGIQNPQYSAIEAHEVEVLQLTNVVNFLRLETHLASDIDVMWIDDPQPLGMVPLIKTLYPNTIVIWRCHVHVDPEPSIKSLIREMATGKLNPERDYVLTEFLKKRGKEVADIKGADVQVFHRQIFADNLALGAGDKVHIMPPCINPLSFKNMQLNDALVEATLVKYGIMQPRVGRTAQVPPFVLEVSRFDPYKGPIELITAFTEAAKQMPEAMQREIRLVMVSSLPGDNPSGIRLARILQEFIDALDLSAFPADQRAGAPNDLRKRIFLLMLDDKAPWEKLLERLDKESGYDPDRLAGVRREVCELASQPLPEICASLERCGLIPPTLAEKVAKPPLPDGVSFTKEQKAAILKVLDETRARRHPGGTAVTQRRAEQDGFNGKEINAFEVNALQSSALVKVQFSSKEGFGLVVSESLVKCLPGYEGAMVVTLVGGIRPQADACECLKIEYPAEEAADSLQAYRSLPDSPSTEYFLQLYKKIGLRQSVKELQQNILKAALLDEAEKVRMSQAARKGVLANFSTTANVHNILRGIRMATKQAW